MVTKPKASTAGQGDAKAAAAAAAAATTNAAKPEEDPPAEEDDETVKTGTFSFSDEGEYCLVGGKVVRQGHGSFWTGAEKYEGEWLHDQMHGRGAYSFATGATYDGEFQCNAFHGVGRYRWADGAHYEGGWHFNKYVLQLVVPCMDVTLFVDVQCGIFCC
ncbi:unnamed protein product [Phytophthora fragariaefolia]|uniref:Unnamed protein product n=1 Tax=Phytophthora fragariaefolia TaxID=1490495 RepID=A0A9W7D5A7_9STRA|nr:unnamed protein product [Phytophthora fragariaefolia]